MNANRLLGLAGGVGLVISIVTLASLAYIAPPQGGAPAVQVSKIEPEVATAAELASLEDRLDELAGGGGEDVQASVEEVLASVEEVQASVDDIDARVSDLEQSASDTTTMDDLESRLSELEAMVDTLCSNSEFGC